MFSTIYNLPLNKYFSSNFNLSFGAGVSFNFGILSKKMQLTDPDGSNKTYLSDFMDDNLGYHLSSIFSYKFNDTFHIGIKGLYRRLNFPKMDTDSEFGLDFSGFEINLILNVFFRENEN